ncbi:sigma-70 family RNA polymerase sigma factor [Salinicoccus sesuvii]|uniref:Sigma-70 family RNA polymerase sigma factor n=1 Tax=Salinicoccus sesuvii TaxID=868281 RepID=A0ABV7N6E2_9STAP
MDEKIVSYEPMVYSIMNKLNIQFDKDDYMQVGRLAIFSALSTYDDIAAKGATESQFVYTRIYQRLIDEIRKVSKYTNAVSVTVDDHLHECVGGRADPLEMLALETTQHQLETYELMWLSYTLRGYSVREIAEQSGYSVSSVKNWRKSAREKLYCLFDEC